jgi:3',5'-nucleoside bisphosphate phosphatase
MTATCPARLDLHLHSRISDGTHAPDALASMAFRAGVRIAACTDHDSFGGSRDFRGAFERLGGVAVPGCEVTATWQGSEEHCLVYGAVGGQFTEWVGLLHARRLDWLHATLDLVEQAGVPVSRATLEREAGAGRVPYFGVILRMVKAAAGDDPRFARYGMGNLLALQRDWFERGGPFHVPEPRWPELEEVIARARDAGGIPVLAHPAKALTRLPDPAPVLDRLFSSGLAGLEAWTTWHTVEQSVEVARLCRQHGLLATQGSDFHGTDVKPWVLAPGHAPAGAGDADAMLAALLAS